MEILQVCNYVKANGDIDMYGIYLYCMLKNSSIHNVAYSLYRNPGGTYLYGIVLRYAYVLYIPIWYAQGY